MKLLLDIGNTRIKWATCVDYSLVQSGFEQSGEVVHGNDPDVAVAAMLQSVTGVPLEVRAANVAGERFAAAAAAAVHARWNLPVCFAATQASAGVVRNAYDDYHKLGIDRWLAILAAVTRCEGGICVVDAGTAVTFDLVDADGRHRGGYIVPGIDLMWRALLSDTGDLERLAGMEAGRDPSSSLAPGRGTVDAIGGGALSAICALAEHCVGQLSKDNSVTSLVLTGGDARRLMSHLSVDVEYRPQLVLEGLAVYEPGALPGP